MLDSAPFAVTPGALSVAATRTGDALRVEVGYEARQGWRLLDLAARSNARVPLRRGPVAVEVALASGATRRFPDATLRAPGEVVVTLDADAVVRSVTVRDRYGNEGAAAP